MKIIRTYDRKVTAVQGKALRALLELLTKLKVNRRCVETLSMQKTTLCEPNQYRLTIKVRDK